MFGSRTAERLAILEATLEQEKPCVCGARLDSIETRLERLELDTHQRQIEVLTALDKALHQLRSRARVRERRESPETDEDGVTPTPSTPPTTAHLSARFRRF